jgi:hypothetical protein
LEGAEAVPEAADGETSAEAGEAVAAEGSEGEISAEASAEGEPVETATMEENQLEELAVAGEPSAEENETAAGEPTADDNENKE